MSDYKELIAEAQAADAAYVHEDLIGRLSDALKAAVRERDELASVVEQVRGYCRDPEPLEDVPDDDLTDVQYGSCALGQSLLDILGAAPGSVQRE